MNVSVDFSRSGYIVQYPKHNNRYGVYAMDPLHQNRQILKKKIAVRLFIVPLIYAVLLFLPAGTFDYWQAYVYFAAIMGPMFFVVRYFLKHDPEFLEHRMNMKEKEREQKKIVSVSAVLYVIGFLLPGVDRRYGWSDVPVPIVIAADVLVMASYIFIIYVFTVNRYASRVIQIQKDQTVISTGPYGIVRHPMYSGTIVMFLSTPLALGSYWALIPFVMVLFTFVLRILNEEKVLSEQLAGYREYCTKVRYRLVPFVW